MPQQLRRIPVQSQDPTRRTDKEATATGNNAAWICFCGYESPLVGRSGSVKGPAENTIVKCPRCGAVYFVVPEGYDQGSAKEVIELQRG